jgi:hypothetical protein
MAWTGPQFAKKNHALDPAQSSHAARIANAVLKRSGDEGLSIAMGNKYYQHRDDGGAVTGFGGVTPTTAAMNPMAQQSAGYYNQMSTEQLQEAAIRMKGSPQGATVQRILQQKRILGDQPSSPGVAQAVENGPKPMNTAQQAPAATGGFARGGDLHGPPKQYAIGGALDPDGGAYMTERGISQNGFLHTAGPGRTDNLGIKPTSDSYVLPADVVSGLGEGNSLAGAKALDAALHTGPHGIPLPPGGGHHMGPPPPPHQYNPNQGFAGGGAQKPNVPIEAAGGEYVVSPEQCAALGGGNVDRGHKVLDAFVLHIRKRTVKDLKNLKGPVKS